MNNSPGLTGNSSKMPKRRHPRKSTSIHSSSQSELTKKRQYRSKQVLQNKESLSPRPIAPPHLKHDAASQVISELDNNKARLQRVENLIFSICDSLDSDQLTESIAQASTTRPKKRNKNDFKSSETIERKSKPSHYQMKR